MRRQFDAVFIATGAGLPRFMNIPGEHLGGVYSANEFLTRVNLMKAYDPDHFDSPVFDCRGKLVAVVGGGNTAMDSVRSALRLGATNAYIIYRRSEAEMPARAEEIHHAQDEGVQFITLCTPVEFIGNQQGYLTGVRLCRMVLGDPDDIRSTPGESVGRFGVFYENRYGRDRDWHRRQPIGTVDDSWYANEQVGLYRRR